MANTYPYTGLPSAAARWAEDEPTSIDRLNVSRQNADHLYEALNTIMDTDAADGVLTGSVTGTQVMQISSPAKWQVDTGVVWSAGWWQDSASRWWLLVRAADVSSFTRAQADFYIPTGNIADVPST